ncbi:Uncharacterised protein [Vibrio cholerae]|nr:Uncharacterised protein [Vibrio cholerae]
MGSLPAAATCNQSCTIASKPLLASIGVQSFKATRLSWLSRHIFP